MKLLIIGLDNSLSSTIRNFTRYRITAVLKRFSKRIRQVHVRLDDVNGPKGGVDKLCKIEVAMIPSGRLYIEEIDDDMHAAVNKAADRIKRLVSKQIHKQSDRHRVTPLNHLPPDKTITPESSAFA